MLCSETFEYDLRDEKYDLVDNEDYISDIKERGYVYKNDLKYVEHNEVDINKVGVSKNNYDFSTLDSRFKEMKDNNYEMLDLNHMKLDVLPQIDNIKHIKYLFLTHNNFVDIDLSNFVNLVAVDISFNKLTKVPILPKGIVEVTITNNLIDKENLYKYNYLKRVNLSNNNLSNIKVIDSLETLICDNNNIRFIGNFVSLKDLRCDNNKITAIHPMKKLLVLSCCNNRITEINGFEKLVEIYCDDNNIEIIKNLPLVEVIHCVKNKITNVAYFSKLLEIKCDYNDTLSISKLYKIDNTQMNEKYVTVCFKYT